MAREQVKNLLQQVLDPLPTLETQILVGQALSYLREGATDDEMAGIVEGNWPAGVALGMVLEMKIVFEKKGDPIAHNA